MGTQNRSGSQRNGSHAGKDSAQELRREGHGGTTTSTIFKAAIGNKLKWQDKDGKSQTGTAANREGHAINQRGKKP